MKRHPVQVCLEEQEGGQTGGDHGIALGQGFGGIADGIQAVGYLADFGPAPAISLMPLALSVMGPKVSMDRT